VNKIAYIFFFLSTTLFGQDVHFVQSSTTPQLINPATAGVFDGWERVSISHRQQWLSIGSPYVTSQLSADLNLLKNENGTSKGYLGVGINFYSDVAGDAKFGTNKFSLALNGIIQVTEDQTASVAIEIGGAQRSGDVNKLEWGNQFNGQDGFDSQIASNEANISSFIHPDFGLGVFLQV
jgi:type IX secretion system PorP/SprF family membrane protein